MKCPKCGSTDTKKVSVLDPNWKPGAQRCNACQHQEHWLAFCSKPVAAPNKIGWESWELVEVGLVNVARCAACRKFVHYNGYMPKTCPYCQEGLKPS